MPTNMLNIVSRFPPRSRVQGIIGPFRGLHNSAYNEPHVLAIDVPYRSSSDQSIKPVSFHSGDGFFFPRFDTCANRRSVGGISRAHQAYRVHRDRMARSRREALSDSNAFSAQP